MAKLLVFDIKEFALFDGPGIRTTVFLKGCPLRCQWCHNPEGLSFAPQLMVSPSACTHCGRCRQVCTHDPCIACGACVSACPQGLRRIAGTPWAAEDLARELLRGEDLLCASGGGVTFSGGEPMGQWEGVRAAIACLDGLHTAIETSGYCPDAAFAEMMDTVDLVMMDAKLMDPALHRRYTGVDNAPILRHLECLCRGNTPFVIRVPLIPGINDNLAHLEPLAERLEGARRLQRVELLPYHRTAGAKYAMVGLDYRPDFDTARDVQVYQGPFIQRGIDVCVL